MAIHGVGPITSWERTATDKLSGRWAHATVAPKAARAAGLLATAGGRRTIAAGWPVEDWPSQISYDSAWWARRTSWNDCGPEPGDCIHVLQPAPFEGIVPHRSELEATSGGRRSLAWSPALKLASAAVTAGLAGGLACGASATWLKDEPSKANAPAKEGAR